MTQYVDSSALIKRYVHEPDSEDARRLLLADPDWVTANHTYTEVYRALGLRSAEDHLASGRAALEDDWRRTIVVLLTDEVCKRAGVLADLTGAKTLDALHLAAAERAGARALPFLTFDVRQAAAARSLGYTVLG